MNEMTREVGELLTNVGKLAEGSEQNIMIELQKKIISLDEAACILDNKTRNKIAETLYSYMDREKMTMTVFLYSFLVKFSNNTVYMESFISLLLKEKIRNVNIWYFLYYQIKSIIFHNQKYNTEKIRCLHWQLLKYIVDAFSAQVGKYSWIEEKERNQELVVVITEQFLMEQHGPTKTALDRCKTIKQKMNKKVLLINTAECLPQVGHIPFFEPTFANYVPEFKEVDKQRWKGIAFDYVQCDLNMPDVDVLRMFIEYIRRLKPCLVVAIGGSGMLINLLKDSLTVLTVGLGPAALEATMAQYQTLSVPLKDSDRRTIRELGFTEEHVIQSIFTSSLKVQTSWRSRRDFQLPEDKKVLVVVGARLDVEVTDEFCDMLESLEGEAWHVTFVGRFLCYDAMMKKHLRLHKNANYLGFQDDILSVMDNCDLYVNPIRNGGGTSCVEALSKGVPVVSVNIGDVAVNVGESFCVENYRQMKLQIEKYLQDKEFYNKKSEEAKQRADILLDTDTEFVRIINEVFIREGNRENVFK